jgi:CCR4-NOT transcription complex subunit 6
MTIFNTELNQAYPYCDPWNLTWPYRRTLIIQEIIDTQGDIICLQEVQADHFENTFQQIMSDLGYDGLFKQKTRESMGQHGKVDGCAMFWKRSKFMLVENYTIEFNECARRSALQLGLEDSDLHRYVSRLSKDNIAQVVILEALPRASRPRAGGGGTQPAPNHICIVNTHLYSNHTRPEVKLWQTLTLMREIEPYVVQQDLALLICGDFNSEPLSAVYEFLNHGYVNENHEELVEDTANPLLPDTEHVVHSLDLASAMATALGEEPSFTNYTKNFRGTLDYMWYTPSRLKVLAVSNIPDESEVIQYGEALPNVCYPSDHLLLCCDLLLTASSGNNSVNAMRNNRTNGLKMGGQQLSQNSAMQSMVGVSPGPKSKGGQPLRR